MKALCSCTYKFYTICVEQVEGEIRIASCILYNQRDATYTMFFIIISAVHVSFGFSAHHQEVIKLYVQLWVLSFFPAVYRWCGWVGTMTIPKATYTDL